MAGLSDWRLSARDGRDSSAVDEAFRAFADRHPEVRLAFRDVLREHCPAEYHLLLEIQARKGGG